MKIKQKLEDMRQELSNNNVRYCCYCLDASRHYFECCGENHFLPFDSLGEKDQNTLIDKIFQDKITNIWPFPSNLSSALPIDKLPFNPNNHEDALL